LWSVGGGAIIARMVRRAAAAAIAITALLASAATAGAATTRYVAKGGTDTANDCSVQTNPCLTIGHAVTKAAAGDMIAIGPGTFSEAVTDTKNKLTFAGAGSTGAGATFVDASGTTSQGFYTGGEDATFENLHIRGGVTGAGQILGAIEGGASPAPSVTIAGCLLDEASPASPSGWDAAVDFEVEPSALTIYGTTLEGYQGGVVQDGGTGASLTMVGDTVTEPFLPPPMGMHLILGSDSAVATGAAATISDSTLNATDGLRVDDTQATVTRTVIHASEFGVAVNDGATGPTLTMRDSVVAPGGGTMVGGVIVGKGVASPAPASVSLTGVSVLALFNTKPRALDVTAAPGSTIHVRNSILQALDPGGTTTNQDIAGGAAGMTWDVGFTAFTTSTGTGVPAPGSGTNINAAPQYVDDLFGDLHLQSTSPLFDKGDPSQVLPGETDITGAPRAVDHDCDGVALPDLGAYEAPALPCPPPPAPPSPPAPPPPAKDTTPPVISALRFDPTTFAADHTHPHHGRHIESTLRFTLSEAATLKVDVELVVHHSGGHPATYTIIGSVTYHGEHAGADTRTFSGLIGAHPLHSAEYRAIVIATDAAGNVSSHHHLYFTVDNT